MAPGRATHRRLHSAFALFLALISSALLAGCGSILVTDRTAPTPPPSSPAQQRPSGISAPNTQATHDLAIAALDFDPALNAANISLGRPYSLLVALENKGNRTETAVTVTAQLLTQDRQQVLMSSQRTVSTLAAGDLTVVRFPGNSTPPSYRTYLLSVQVQPAPLEANTQDNKRTLEIEINPSN